MDDGCVDNIIIVSRRQDEQRGFFKKQRENKRQGLDIPTWHKYNNSCSSRSWRNRQTRTFEGRMGDRMGSSPIDRTTKLMKRVHIAPFLHAHAAVMYVGVHSLAWAFESTLSAPF